MAQPIEIQYKFWRVKQHHDELLKEAKDWFESGPGELLPAPDSTPENRVYIFSTRNPVPARFGLVAGDFLQNLRSTLDYLVWQLVIANKKKPGRSNAFPVCLTPDGYVSTLANNRLKGVHKDAVDLIKTFQPAFAQQTTSPHPLHVLDELTNENKHRTPLLTTFASVRKPDEPVPFPHVELEVSRVRDGEIHPGERLIAFLAFKHPLIDGMEVLSALYALSNYVGFDVLPKFERFF